MAVKTVTSKNFEEKVLKASIPVVADFWAPWCGPCKMAEPVLKELSEEYEGKVDFVKINVDDEQALVGKYSIMSIPTTVLFKEGKEMGRRIGFSGKQGFEDLVKKGVM